MMFLRGLNCGFQDSRAGKTRNVCVQRVEMLEIIQGADILMGGITGAKVMDAGLPLFSKGHEHFKRNSLQKNMNQETHFKTGHEHVHNGLVK
jgi:hypothetical protein